MTYLRRHGLNENHFPELVTVEVTVHEPEVIAFRDFLADNIEAHDSGRLTISDIWIAWAAHCGADPADKDDRGHQATGCCQPIQGALRSARAGPRPGGWTRAALLDRLSHDTGGRVAATCWTG